LQCFGYDIEEVIMKTLILCLALLMSATVFSHPMGGHFHGGWHQHHNDARWWHRRGNQDCYWMPRHHGRPGYLVCE